MSSEVIIFVLELVLTLIGFGLHTFFCGPDRWWNTLDFAFRSDFSLKPTPLDIYSVDYIVYIVYTLKW